MGYTLELRVGSVEEVARQLREPHLRAVELGVPRGEDPETDEVLDRWDELARTAADGVAGGGGEIGGLLAGYLHLVVRRLTHWYGALAHTSSGGADFRGRLLAGPVTQVLGADAVRHLLNREVAGLVSTAHPMVGWIGAGELRTLVDGGLTIPDDVGTTEGSGSATGAAPGTEADEEAVLTLVAAVERAARTGQDLLGVYG